MTLAGPSHDEFDVSCQWQPNESQIRFKPTGQDVWFSCHDWSAITNIGHGDCYTVCPSATRMRLLYSLILVAEGQNETWPPIGWHNLFVISWSKYRLGLPQPWWIVWSHDWWGFARYFRGFTPLTQSEWREICLRLGLCKTTVKESTCHRKYSCYAQPPWWVQH